MSTPLATTQTPNGPGVQSFDTGSVAIVGATGTWQLVALLQLGGNKQGLVLDLLNAAGAALANLKLSRSGAVGGHAANAQVDFATGAAINTAGNDVASAWPASISTLGAGVNGSIRLQSLQGVQEIGVWVQVATSSTANLQVRGAASS
jgi:uncharacterized protein YqfA (UPF0365 family)